MLWEINNWFGFLQICQMFPILALLWVEKCSFWPRLGPNSVQKCLFALISCILFHLVWTIRHGSSTFQHWILTIEDICRTLYENELVRGKMIILERINTFASKSDLKLFWIDFYKVIRNFFIDFLFLSYFKPKRKV